MNILFDIQGTLVAGGQPVEEMLRLLRDLSRAGHTVYVASSGGVPYAREWCERLGIADLVVVIAKGEAAALRPDVSFDDREVRYGWVNLQVRIGR
jgi:FMN phosphatase YigB (HAD superfamily)